MCIRDRSMAESYGITNVDYQYDYDTFSFELPVQDSVVGNTNSVKFEADGDTRSSQDGLSKSYSTHFGDQSYYLFCHNTSAVSYTHLDVYKRQSLDSLVDMVKQCGIFHIHKVFNAEIFFCFFYTALCRCV